jgi:hypothetical protein
VERQGRPYKDLSLSIDIEQIVSSLMNVEQPEVKYEPWAIDVCLDMIEDNMLDEKTRVHYAESLKDIFTSMPEKILLAHEKVRQLLEDTVRNPRANDEISRLKMSMVENSIPRLTAEETTRSWVRSFVYPNALRILRSTTEPKNLDEKRPDCMGVWSVAILGEIGRIVPDSKLRREIKDDLVKAYFDDDLKLESALAGKLVESILDIMHQEPEAFQAFATDLRNHAKSSEETEKTKALLFLEKILGKLGVRPIL